MSSSHDLPESPFGPLQATINPMRAASLRSAISDVDLLLEELERAKRDIAEGNDLDQTRMKMLQLQNPVKSRCDALTDDLKKVTKAQKAFTKALDKTLPVREIPMEVEMIASQSDLINAAIGMHLLREGQFQTAATFHNESKTTSRADATNTRFESQHASSHVDKDGDDDMGADGDTTNDNDSMDVNDGGGVRLPVRHEMHESFQQMFEILQQIKCKNLFPAIEWTRRVALHLEARGSNLGFELTKLQYIWLFMGPAVNGLPDDENNGVPGARAYARTHLSPFMRRHPKEVQQLCSAVVFASNLGSSPYAQIFDIANRFEEVATAFTREFCAQLGLAAESPLQVATTAGAIALPNLLKYNAYKKQKGGEWTSLNELAFETPLPSSMVYHPIFVCPVSKEQATADNPAVILPCGHVISTESLSKMTKRQGSRVKCPYCTWEGPVKESQEISF